MHDDTAFERQIGIVLDRMGGPEPTFDAMAVARTAAAPSPQRRLQTMFSAAKLLVAAAIVALFGGFLLAEVLMPPSDELMPAAASPSPATTPDLLPGVDLVTEEVEPGVFRVLSDGTDNALGFEASHPEATQVVAGQDGSVWVYDQSRLFRLGLAGGNDASRLHDYRPDISVAPDGTVWALGDSATTGGSGAGEGQLFSLTGREWTTHAVPNDVWVTGIETPADGSVWATWAVGTGTVEGCSGYVRKGGRLAVASLAAGGWQQEDIEPATIAAGGRLAIGPDGTTLLGTTFYAYCGGDFWVGVLERNEDGWVRSITVETVESQPSIGPIAIGHDGTMWAYQQGAVEPWGPRLLRRTDGDWRLSGMTAACPCSSGRRCGMGA